MGLVSLGKNIGDGIAVEDITGRYTQTHTHNHKLKN